MKKGVDFNLGRNIELADAFDEFVDDNEWGIDTEDMLVELSLRIRRTTRHLEFWLEKYMENNKEDKETLENTYLATCTRCDCLHEQKLKDVLGRLTDCVYAFNNGHTDIFEGVYCFDCEEVLSDFS